jgi:glycolate oxidase FAD binding subunit
VLPRPLVEVTLEFQLAEGDATRRVNEWAGQPLPLSATAWQDGVLRVRLSGAESAIGAARRKLGGEEVSNAGTYWSDLREHRLAFFAGEAPLWRVSLPQTAEPLVLAPSQSQLIEWGGGLRWLKTAAGAGDVRNAAKHATLFRAADKSAGAFAPLEPVNARLHKALKAAFDPAGILNPGRMYADF